MFAFILYRKIPVGGEITIIIILSLTKSTPWSAGDRHFFAESEHDAHQIQIEDI